MFFSSNFPTIYYSSENTTTSDCSFTLKSAVCNFSFISLFDKGCSYSIVHIFVLKSVGWFPIFSINRFFPIFSFNKLTTNPPHLREGFCKQKLLLSRLISNPLNLRPLWNNCFWADFKVLCTGTLYIWAVIL